MITPGESNYHEKYQETNCTMSLPQALILL